MREAQKVEGLRLSFPAFLAIRCGEPTEFDEAGLFRVKRQRELGQALSQVMQESLGVSLMLKSHHEIISVPNDNGLAPAVLASPPFHPHIQHLMQVDIRQQR